MTDKKARNLPFPPHWINSYLFEKLGEYGANEVGISSDQTIMPFFPTVRTSTQELYDQFYEPLKEDSGLDQPTMINYDRLMRFRTTPFYAIKKEQLLYTIYGTLPAVQNIAIIVSQLLDREDAAAQDINDWAKENPISLNGQQIDSNVFFHGVRVYQIDETRDLLELESVNVAPWVAKIIVEYDYHAKSESTFN